MFANYGLQRAVALANQSGRPLLIFEPLRVSYPHASARIHRFVLDGMADNARVAASAGVTYLPYVEPRDGAGRGMLAALAVHAVAVVTDDAPWFFYPAMLRAAVSQVNCRFEAVDGDGLLPMREPNRTFRRAHDFRRHLHKRLPEILRERCVQRPLDTLRVSEKAVVPPDVVRRWPAAARELLSGEDDSLASLPVDQQVGPVQIQGGHTAASGRLDQFVETLLSTYADKRNHPDHDGSSRLAPWLHFGHIGADEVFQAVTARFGWSAEQVCTSATGRRAGWWHLPPGPEAFLDQLLTWRELGRNACVNDASYMSFDRLPDWSKRTLEAHELDPRDEQYTLEQLEGGQTQDPIWNAAQNQLRRDGRMHNYLRMLWGKKILEWSPSPRDALDRMIYLNNRYALDGRDPNSYSGIFWVLGRYDRAWGPEREIYGKVRYMSSANTARKLRLRGYLAEYGSDAESG